MSATQESTERRGGLLRSSAIVSSMTMLSRVLGLMRDILFAKFIGAGGDADAANLADPEEGSGARGSPSPRTRGEVQWWDWRSARESCDVECEDPWL